MITIKDIKHNQAIKTYIVRADQTLASSGFTEHSFAHVTKTATDASKILISLGYDLRLAELAEIAGYMHDIGNIVNRIDHAQSGAVLAFRILDNLGMDADEIATIISAIGNHDESTAVPVNPVASALILADKSDVRRTRVRNTDFATFDIHDRVNYAATASDLSISEDKKKVTLNLTIDTEISPVISYFEIFLGRMMLCRKAAVALGMKFELIINNQKLL